MFLGVDGGGTKTAFLIIDKEGNILSYKVGPTSHYKQTSFSNFRDVLRNGIDEVCKDVGIKIEDIDYSFIGIPGFGEITRDQKELELIVKDILGKDNFQCGNDSEVAWAGSLACKPGINIVAGTGAIGYGIDKNGNSYRSSGWGEVCGDEGSAYWLGKKLIEVFTKEIDGRINKTKLYDIVKKELSIEDDFEILDIVLNKFKSERHHIASLGKLLYIGAKANDKTAIDIYKQAAYEHFLMAKAIIENLEFEDEEYINISYSGGVFNAGDYVLEPLKELLYEYKRNTKLVKSILQPVSGAALYAMYLSDHSIDNIIENLQKEEESWILK